MKIRSHHRQPAVFSAGCGREKRPSQSSPAVLSYVEPSPIIVHRRTASRTRRIFACVFPHEPAQVARVETAAKNSGLVHRSQTPVVFREGDPPLVALFGLMRAEDLPDWFRGQTWTEPDLIIRTRDGQIHPEYSAVNSPSVFRPELAAKVECCGQTFPLCVPAF